MRRTERRGLRTGRENRMDSSEPSQSPTLSPQSFEIHIEELVLHGFSSADRHPIGEALERHLTKLFTEGPAPRPLSRNETIDRIEGGMFRADNHSIIESVAAHTAGTVYEGLWR